MKLYHGSNVEIDVIDLRKGRRGKDFMQEIQYARETFQYFFGTEKAINCLTKTGTV